MARKATLTFGMDLSDFNNAMRAINRQSRDASAQIAKVTEGALEAYRQGLKELKVNSLEQNLKAKLATLKQDIKNAARTISLPIKAAIDFENAMADVKKVVDFKSGDELKAFSNELLKMSQVIPVSAEGLTQIASALAQMGIAKDELVTFTDLVAKTAVAFGITADSAGKSIGEIKNALALNINETSEMMDAINHLSNKNATKASEIVEVMKQIAGIGKQVGITKEQTAALAASFIALGKTPETASSASEALLKKLNNIGSLNKKMQEAFESIGLDTARFQGLMKKDAQSGVLLFLETMKKIEPQRRGSLLSAIMGTTYDSDIATLISGIDVYKKALAEVGDKSNFIGSNEAEFKAQSEATANAIQLMNNSFYALGVSIGNIFLPYVNSAIKAISDFIKKVSVFVQNNENLVKNIGIAISSLFALKTTFLGARIASSLASFSILGYAKTLAVAFPRVLKLAGFSILGYAKILTKLPFYYLQLSGSLRGCNMSFKALSMGILRQIQYLRIYALIAGGTRGVLRDLGMGAWNSARGIGKFSLALTLAPFKIFLAGLSAIKAGFLALVTNPMGIVIAILAGGALLIYKNWQGISAFFVGMWQGIKEGLEPLAQSLKTAFAPLKPIFSLISDFFSSLFSQTKESEESLEGFKNAGKAVGEAIASVIDIIAKPIVFITDSIKMIIEAISSSEMGRFLAQKLGIITENSQNTPAPTTKGAIASHIEYKKEIATTQNSKNQTINNNINISVAKSNASAQEIAREVANNSYAFND